MTETPATATAAEPAAPADAPQTPADNVPAKATAGTGTTAFLLVLGALAAIAAAYLIVRAFWRKRPPDETAERIQSLIDEANRLIRTLEEKK